MAKSRVHLGSAASQEVACALGLVEYVDVSHTSPFSGKVLAGKCDLNTRPERAPLTMTAQGPQLSFCSSSLLC